jgi:hypothetical protein
MASIKISDLRPSDFDMFGDSETFLNDLSDNDLATINGGKGGIWGAIASALTGGISVHFEVNIHFH